MIIRFNNREMRMPTEDLPLRGRHNLYNSLAAAVAARAMEVRSDVIRESMASFEGVPHRLEFVRELDGVRYYNDSKATNPHAAVASAARAAKVEPAAITAAVDAVDSRKERRLIDLESLIATGTFVRKRLETKG